MIHKRDLFLLKRDRKTCSFYSIIVKNLISNYFQESINLPFKDEDRNLGSQNRWNVLENNVKIIVLKLLGLITILTKIDKYFWDFPAHWKLMGNIFRVHLGILNPSLRNRKSFNIFFIGTIWLIFFCNRTMKEI